MSRKHISATELAEFVYCGKAWELNYILRTEPSSETQSCRLKAMPGISSGQAARPERQFPVGCFRRPCTCSDPVLFRMAGWGKMNVQVMAATLLILALLLFLPCGKVTEEDRHSCRGTVLPGSGRPTFLRRGAAFRETWHFRKAGLPDTYCGRHRARRIKEVEQTARPRRSLSEPHDPGSGVLRSSRGSNERARSIRAGHLRRAAGAQGRVHRCSPPMASSHDPGGRACA